MISPQEIRTVTFDKVMRGYRTEDVDALLQQLAQQMEELQAEKESTEKKLYVLAQKVEEYRKDEDNLKTALLNAQRMGENVIKEAKQKAESILREAEGFTEEKDFKNSVLSLYKQHIESLSTLPGDEPEEPEEEPSSPAEEEPEAAAPQEPQAPAEPDLFGESFDEQEQPEDPIGQFPDLGALYDAPQAPEEETPGEEPTRTFVPGQSRPAPQQAEAPSAPSVFEGFEGIKFSD